MNSATTKAYNSTSISNVDVYSFLPLFRFHFSELLTQIVALIYFTFDQHFMSFQNL